MNGRGGRERASAPESGQADRLRHELDQRTRELSALAEVNRAIAHLPDLEYVLQRLVQEAADLIGADGAGIAFIPDGDPTGELEVGASVGVMDAPSNRRLPLHGSITGRVVRTGRAEVVADVTKDPDQYPLEPEPVPTQSAIAVPLRVRDETIGGLLVVRGPALPVFDEHQRDLLQRFADQAAIAIQQARLIRRLEEANRLKEDFLATLSHELRTPLTGILLWTDILRGTPHANADGETAGEGFEIITQSAQLLLSMVDDLLDLGRIQAGKIRLERQLVDPAALVAQAIRPFHRRCEEVGLEFHEEIDKQLPPVAVDPARLQQILWNLLSNAVKFTEPPGTVRTTARTTKSGSDVEIAVADTGCGIPAETLPHIFERFRQGDASPTRRHGGLGIGLTLARALVRAHGGTIQVETEVGRGSVFTVRLPAASPAAAAGSGPMEEADEATHSAEPSSHTWTEHRATVLLAEDARPTRQALVRVLSSRGFRMLEAGDGEEVLRIARADRPDVILMDIAMPRIDGITALAQLREDVATADIPVAAVTARAMPDDRKRIEAAGFDGYLTKPFRVPELLALLERLLAPRPAGDA